MSEVQMYEETGQLPEHVTYLEQRLDVGWYGRRCRKTKRDQLRDIELGQSSLPVSLAQEVSATRWVEEGPAGTTFCSRRTPSHALVENHLGAETAVDSCCMALWACSSSPSHPLPGLGWSQGRLNSLLWPVWSCSCLGSFLACLGDTRTQLGIRLYVTLPNI